MDQLEGIAAELLGSTGVGDVPPVNAFVLAAACGLDVFRTSAPGAHRMGDQIFLNTSARAERQHGLLAHEIGHWALERAGEDSRDEDAARFLSGALMLPRRALDVDLRRTWRVDHLRQRHVNASAEMIARRITQVRAAVATVIDNGKQRTRVASPWLGVPPPLAAFERALVDEALRTGEAAECELAHAVPLIDGRWQRVVVVVDADRFA